MTFSAQKNLLEPLTNVHYRSLLWIGPALIFSTATTISVLGWDGKVRTILSISMPYAGMSHNLGVDYLSSNCIILPYTVFIMYLSMM